MINLYCTSGRHRSVAVGTMIYHYLNTTDAREPMLLHYHSPEWDDMSCGGHCSLCGTADARELSRLIDRFIPDVRIVSPTVPRPTLTPARGHITGPTRTHSTVPVPLRGPLPPSLATTASGTPLTPTHYPSYPPPSREAGASHGGGRDYERGERDVRDRDLAVQVLANQVQ